MTRYICNRVISNEDKKICLDLIPWLYHRTKFFLWQQYLVIIYCFGFKVQGSYLESNKKSNNMATYNVTSKKCNAGNVCHQFLHYFEVLLCSGSPPRVIHWMGWNKNFALLPVLPSAAASAAERAKFFFGLVAMQLQFGWKRQRPRRKNVEVATPEKKHNFILKHFLLVSAI